MLLRRIARPLFASVFVTDGIAALRAPEPHVTRADLTWRRLAGSSDSPPPDRGQLRTIVRVHAAATAVAGLMLAVGKAPRLAALSLAALTVPVAVAARTSGPGAGESRRLVEHLGLIGAALIAAADTEGRPGMSWRVRHARVDRAAARQANRAVAVAAKEARGAAKAIRDHV